MSSSATPHGPTPLSGLASVVLADPGLRTVVDAAGRDAAVEGPTALRPLLATALAADPDGESGGAGRTVLLVCATEREAEELAVATGELLGEDVVAYLPSWETLPHERLSPRADTVGRRIAILRRLAHPELDPHGRLHVVTAATRSLIQPLVPGLGDLEPVVLREGTEIELEHLTERLVDLAYARVEMVEKRGEFAVRGGIIDLFPPTAESPVRIEFWGDEVSELRCFSVADQRSLPDSVEARPDEVVAPPCRELLLTADVRERAAELSRTHAGTGTFGGDKALGELLGKVAAGIPTEGMESLIPALLPGELQLLPQLLPDGGHVVVCHPERVERRAADLVRTGQEFLEASWLVAADSTEGRAPIDLGASAYRDLDVVRTASHEGGHPWWTLSSLATDPDIEDDSHTRDGVRVVRTGITGVESYRGDWEKAAVDLRAHAASGGAALVVVPAAGTAQRAVEQLTEFVGEDVPVVQGDGTAQAGAIAVLQGRLGDGFVAPESRLVLLTEADLTGSRAAGGDAPTKRAAVKRRNAVDPLTLQTGDFVVHAQHGIGKFVEMTQRTTGTGKAATTREYLVLEYSSSKRGQQSDRLFVPTDQLDQVSRYVGGELPTLNKLGGSDWSKTKSKARKAVRDIAASLVQLYAARQAAPGHAFADDTPWQREMEDAFPYTETPDQASAIDEVKADMEKAVPMDRVISGDVGYGKTEIAVRAAFKAVQDGKQVAVLVPTTLLASQHLQTFTDRMRNFPVTVKGLSRFTSGKEADATIRGLADGTVDVVVGTHRLLQTGITWKDLGLVIIDEEQRFGVEHKEHITGLRAHVDMLSMSATPIPRTLEMSLAGIREMSTILTPPEERHPTLTYVGAYDEKQVAAAIRRELLRDGQVFYIHNRVQSIDDSAAKLRRLVPEARIATAHGQMAEERLERTVSEFWEREHDVLVCTTIVENGLDISNANTLIVERSDTLGLSQLHQLRGRVGRGRERGYAYFLYPNDKPLTETSHERLATIAQHSELGAGTAVAMKDLEIRGAGNILGAEQSGHIAGVGFDLYVRLVGEAVEAFKKHTGADTDDAEEPLAEVRVDLPIDAHVPHDYVDTERLRLDVYRKIAEAVDGPALDAVREELVDRYGEPPTPVTNLLAVAAFRQACRRYGITEVSGQGNQIRFAPVDLPESAQMRLKRLHPRAQLKAASQTLSLPKPTEGQSGSGGAKGPVRMGAAPLRDLELLAWCEQLFVALYGERPAASSPEKVPAGV
ncbi:transcription-repair coupling factor [Actinomycetospora endophytica]|uniref:Transcription-repair-coupling factor n=1 Tax=Actinomycetospora endophytica TaxID=2291215 RepID=A0ABS8P7K2_9PSEU|nr:transcription-repair coupling factor [Actinomycetospora endophytica]MCD2194226.1 transcription-repair coupling factor [Actinomycetospora endophytica]